MRCVVCNRPRADYGNHHCSAKAVRAAERRIEEESEAHDGPDPEPDDDRRLADGFGMLAGRFGVDLR